MAVLSSSQVLTRINWTKTIAVVNFSCVCVRDEEEEEEKSMTNSSRRAGRKKKFLRNCAKIRADENQGRMFLHGTQELKRGIMLR
jgi:hypothetical protein